MFWNAGGFLGDIALPNTRYETEWRQLKLNKSYLEELAKYKDQVLNEGLQIEEEGLTGDFLFFFAFQDKQFLRNEYDTRETLSVLQRFST